MRVNKFKCNVCGKVFGLDNTGWGLELPSCQPLNPRDAEDVHLCENCITIVAMTAVTLGLIRHSLTTGLIERA